jgi:hypothetical protein
MWESEAPTECEICHQRLDGCFIDGKTDDGPWAIMCSSCHLIRGCGLGEGHGQKYDLKTLERVE